jgi:hypothetical protein
MDGTMRDLLKPLRRDELDDATPSVDRTVEVSTQVDDVMVKRPDDAEWQPLDVGH